MRIEEICAQYGGGGNGKRSFLLRSAKENSSNSKPQRQEAWIVECSDVSWSAAGSLEATRIAQYLASLTSSMIRDKLAAAFEADPEALAEFKLVLELT